VARTPALLLPWTLMPSMANERQKQCGVLTLPVASASLSMASAQNASPSLTKPSCPPSDLQQLTRTALVDPKTKEWIPSGRLRQWQPRVDHVAHLLHALKASFKTAALDAVTEEQAVNKQVYS
jgi:hypothetical protein